MLAALFLGSSLMAGAAQAAPARGVTWMDGKPYFPLGVNYAWKDWGKDFAAEGWDERFQKIQADFDLMHERGARVVRWWVYTDFVASPLWTKTGICIGMPEGWVQNFVAACDAAHKRGMKLYPTLSSFDMGRTGMDAPMRDKDSLKSFIDMAVIPLLKATAAHPGIFAWDIINEPEWLISKRDGGDPNEKLKGPPHRLEALRHYIREIASAVHLYARQPVSVGSAGMKWCGQEYDFYSGLGLDFFDIHYYDWQTKHANLTVMGPDQMRLGIDTGKPVIIGECISIPEKQYSGPGKPKNHLRMLQDVVKLGYAGYLPWAWNEVPKLDCSKSIAPSFNTALSTLDLPGHPQKGAP